MATSDHSAAYDLQLFEQKPATILKMQPNQKQSKLQKRRTRLQSLINAAVTLAVSMVALAVVCAMITGRVRLTEIKTDIVEAQNTLNELQSEQIRLQSELTGKLSGQSLDDYAQAQGLHVADSAQINYITRSNGDAVTVNDTEDAWWVRLFSGDLNFFG